MLHLPLTLKHEGKQKRRERESRRRCRKEWRGRDRGWEVSTHGEDGGIEKNGYEGREVSGLGHVSCTLESPQGRGAGRG